MFHERKLRIHLEGWEPTIDRYVFPRANMLSKSALRSVTLKNLIGNLERETILVENVPEKSCNCQIRSVVNEVPTLMPSNEV